MAFRTSRCSLLIAALGIIALPGAAPAEIGMCNGLTAERAAAELVRTLRTKIARVLITVKTADTPDRAAIDRLTMSVAEMLKRAGAYSAEPIGGQPIVVAELDRDRLVEVARDPRIACIRSDTPDRAH
jgi:hypothetical protein